MRAEPPEPAGRRRRPTLARVSSPEDELALLEAAVAPFVADVRATVEPAHAVTFVPDGAGGWLWEARWGATGGWSSADVFFDPAETAPAQATASLAEHVPDVDFGPVTEPWPRCPAHGDHPLDPQVRQGRAAWACRWGGGAVVDVGSLGRRR